MTAVFCGMTTENDMAITGGFGMAMDLERGTARKWVIGRDGVKRWADTGDACEGCRRCGGEMKPSKAIAQTYTGMPDFPGAEVVTLSPGGQGKLVDCLKCCQCGHSVTPNVKVTGSPALSASPSGLPG